MLVVALLVRRTLEEAEVFEQRAAHGDLVKLPVAEMFRTHPKQFIQVAMMSFETVTNTMIVMIFIYFSVISTENVPLIFLTSTLITAGTYAMSNAIYPSFFAELFNVRVRYSGMAIGLQIGILCAGFTPLIATALMNGDKTNWLPPALLVAGSSVLAAIGAIWARETYKTPLEKLGNPVHHRGADADREELSVG